MPADIHYPRRSAYFFASERDELQECLRNEKNEQNTYYLLYGLWTHSSSVVVHLVLSTAAAEEIQLADTHKLNCLGYVAREYTKDLDKSIRSRYPTMSLRETIRIEWNKAKKGDLLRGVFAWPTSVSDSQCRLTEFEVKILGQANPFRHLIPRHHTSINVDNIQGNNESETTQNSFGRQGNDRSVQGDPKTASSPQNSEAALASMPIIKSIQHRVKIELANDETVKTKSELSVVQVEFTHHSRQWWIKLGRNTRVSQHVAVEINCASGSLGWEEIAFEELSVSSKNIISAIRSACVVCQREAKESI